MSGLRARVAVALVAVVVVAWLGVMERDQRLQARGVAAAGRGELRAARSDLDAARLLNPGSAPDLSLAFVTAGLGDRAGAIDRIEAVLRREPDNLGAWALLYQFARGHDAAAARRALAARRRLDPLGARD